MLLARSVFVAAVLAIFVAAAPAEVIPVLQIDWDGGTWYSGEPGTMNTTPSGSGFDFNGSYTGPDWSGNWNGFVDADPIMNSAIAITNNTAMTQTFMSTLTLPTTGAIAPPSSVSCGTSVTVTGLGPATVATPPMDFMFRGLISGVPFPPCNLLPAPFSLSTPTGLPNAFGPVNVGPVMGPGLAPMDSIAIRHSFTLTPGGTATLNSTLIVVPEPASAFMLVLGGLALLRRR